MLCILTADLPPGQWSSWSNRKTAPVGSEELRAAHKGAFCFSSPHGSSTLLGNSLGADIISLSTEWKNIFLPQLSPPSLLSLLPSCSLSLPPYLAEVRCRLSFCAPFTQKVNALVCASANRAPQLFRKPPKNTSVFVYWRSTTEVEFKSAWKSGSGRTWPWRQQRQQHSGSQWLDEWEFVWRLGADGERLLCAHDRDPSESAQQTGFAAEHTATAGLYLVIFLLTACVICLRPVSTEENWQCALLDWFAPSDAAPLCAPTPETQTLPDPVCYLSRIFPTGEYTWTRNHIVSRARKKKGGSRDFFSSSLCRRLSAVAEALRGETHGSLCPKGAVAFWNGFGFFFSLERLLLSPHGCPQFKRSRLRRLSCGLYYLRSRMWNEAEFTRPRKVISWLYLPPR